LPQYRGKGLSFSLHEYCIDQLRKNTVERSVLEVFKQNTQAIKTYKKAGFAITRNINSYKGRPAASNAGGIEIKEQQQADWSWINKTTAWQPAWQYNNHTLQRASHQYRLLLRMKTQYLLPLSFLNPASGGWLNLV
jgi:DNA-binding winged helix-turn-helix (wHTH) protein